MEYENIIKLLKNTLNQPSKFRTKRWVELNDNSQCLCILYFDLVWNSSIYKYSLIKANKHIKFKTSMLISSLCHHGNVYILVKGTITITGAGADDAAK